LRHAGIVAYSSGVEDSEHARAAALADALGALPTALPLLEPDRARLEDAARLADELARASGDAARAALADALARVTRGLLAGEVPFEGSPFFASASATLADPQSAAVALAAARFELESLLPAAKDARPSLVAPDVPASALRRR
jgi:hypothetical protein